MLSRPNLLILALSLCLIIGHATNSEAGPGGTGGGDEIAIEFLGDLTLAMQRLQALDPKAAQLLQSAGAIEAVKLDNIIVVNEPLPVTFEDLIQVSTVTNDSATGVIRINRHKWNQIKTVALKEALAIHEAASLKHLERTGFYPYSGEFISLVESSDSRQNSSLEGALCGVDVDNSSGMSILQTIPGTNLQEFISLAEADRSFDSFRTCIMGKSLVIVVVRKGAKNWAEIFN